MRFQQVITFTALAALSATASAAEARERYRHHHHGNGAAVGAALGAGIFLGALAATSATATEVYVEPEPLPPPPPPALYGRDRGEDANMALAACRRGLLDAARKYGAFDAEIGDIHSIRETEFGYQVRADIRIDYPRSSRTSSVVCNTEDGLLVSARSEY